MSATSHSPVFLHHNDLQQLLQILQHDGYTCIGPQVRDGVIHYDHIDTVEQLPRGYGQHQQPGHYQLEPAGHDRYFAWANGPQALKPWLFSPREALWQCQAGEDKLAFEQVAAEDDPLAVFGVRACDIAALYLHDKHFLQQTHRDPGYRSRRQNLLLVAVNCSHPAETCFCASTGDGPEVHYGHDLVLSELSEGFIVQAHTEKGLSILARLPAETASQSRIAAAQASSRAAAEQQGRRLPSQDLQAALFANLDHPRWEDIARRCLSCGNCTSVCPTCFCHREFDEPSLDGQTSTHYRQWDSCFNQGHSYIHGITLRAETRLRYRQWLTHKLGSWHQQYGRSGCVGCGRCISWCPVGIDLTAEASLICTGSEA